MSETSFKFFIQFVAYTCIFCTFALIVSAYFTAEIRRQVRLPQATHTKITKSQLLTFQPDRRSKPPLVCLHCTVSAHTQDIREICQV